VRGPTLVPQTGSEYIIEPFRGGTTQPTGAKFNRIIYTDSEV
jgi:hypothetical protein